METYQGNSWDNNWPPVSTHHHLASLWVGGTLQEFDFRWLNLGEAVDVLSNSKTELSTWHYKQPPMLLAGVGEPAVSMLRAAGSAGPVFMVLCPQAYQAKWVFLDYFILNKERGKQWWVLFFYSAMVESVLQDTVITICEWINLHNEKWADEWYAKALRVLLLKKVLRNLPGSKNLRISFMKSTWRKIIIVCFFLNTLPTYSHNHTCIYMCIHMYTHTLRKG